WPSSLDLTPSPGGDVLSPWAISRASAAKTPTACSTDDATPETSPSAIVMVCSRTINTSFVERRHAPDRGQNARKSRRSYRFSKDWMVHEAMTYFTAYRYNFRWPVRTLRTKAEDGRWQQRTLAMVAGLADHVWSLEEGITFPAVQRK